MEGIMMRTFMPATFCFAVFSFVQGCLAIDLGNTLIGRANARLKAVLITGDQSNYNSHGNNNGSSIVFSNVASGGNNDVV
jgi:hypothetical protein